MLINMYILICPRTFLNISYFTSLYLRYNILTLISKEFESLKKTINRAMLLNPIVIVIYAIACYYIAQLARYGGRSHRVPVIIVTVLLLFSWFIYAIYKIRKQKDTSQTQKSDEKFMQVTRWWSYLAPLLVGVITLFTGYHIYQSSIPYNGRLSLYVQEFNSEREVAFERNNIYEHGLSGLVEAVSG